MPINSPTSAYIVNLNISINTTQTVLYSSDVAFIPNSYLQNSFLEDEALLGSVNKLESIIFASSEDGTNLTFKENVATTYIVSVENGSLEINILHLDNAIISNTFNCTNTVEIKTNFENIQFWG